jgi:hypothetical protein
MAREAAHPGIRVRLGLRRSALVKQRIARLFQPGWSWTLSHGWTVSAAIATATLLLGAAVAGIPVVAGGSWGDPQVRAQAWAFLALGAAGLAVLSMAAIMHHGRERILRDNGTAYIIKERADGWSDDEARDFLIATKRRFARTIRIPGPGQLDGPWNWPLDERAQQWDEKVTELTRSFRALHSDDDPQSPNGIFMWAWWAVALAFAERVSTADRELVLDVWQRPSAGRAGRLEIIPEQQKAHRFATDEMAVDTGDRPDHVIRQSSWLAEVTAATPTQGVHRPTEHRPVSILVLRLGSQEWGPLPAVTGKPIHSRSARLCLEDAAGLHLPEQFCCDIYEFQSLPPDGQQHFPWAVFPSLADEAAHWVRRTAAELEGHTILVGAVMPPEIAVGLGIAAARADDWPDTLWPILHRPDDHRLIVPRLNLGCSTLGPTRN